ncbi:hypothetical protein F383_31654 [Gossypium arboreum]|uniref:Uncharacterized protein n=1 Tax=Gossypium arboreum TaxID=29729 RepID=A0A0B0PJN3_GOSAR|nr:hypothetical protein F383_31654 [Gossypium arboreum]
MLTFIKIPYMAICVSTTCPFRLSFRVSEIEDAVIFTITKKYNRVWCMS